LERELHSFMDLMNGSDIVKAMLQNARGSAAELEAIINCKQETMTVISGCHQRPAPHGSGEAWQADRKDASGRGCPILPRRYPGSAVSHPL
jgi:hypothetical protein